VVTCAALPFVIKAVFVSVASTSSWASALRPRSTSRAKCSGMIRAPRARPDVNALSGVASIGKPITLNVIDDRNASAYWRESGVWSRSWMTIGISLTVSEIVVPSSATMPTGRASARTSARRSRRICVSSLRIWARMRFIA